MAIQPISNALIYGVSGDSKPTNYANNTLFVEQDTGIIYRWNLGTTAWVVLIGAAKTETITNKTINVTDNTLTDTGTAAGDLLKSNGTKFVKFGKGTGLQFLRTNSGATDLEWVTITNYTEAKGTKTASGDASATTVTIAHGLGTTPSWFDAKATSQDAMGATWLTADGTNITVNYTFAPPSGTNNLTYEWRAAV